MIQFCHTNDFCVLCHSETLEKVVSFPPIPVISPNFSMPDRSNDVPSLTIPLDLVLCRDCGHLQTSHRINEEFNYLNYVYTTSSSLGLVDHFRALANDVMQRTSLPANALIVEMGSNDGSLLRFFKEQGLRVLGVDPARHIAEGASRNGIPTLARFFDESVAREIVATHGRASVILANNVLANIADMTPITRGFDELLAPDGVVVFETQYGVDVVQKTLLDTVYNEHISYFMVKPLCRHFAGHGMEVVDVDWLSSKGGSIRLTVQRRGGPRPVSEAVGRYCDAEDQDGVFGKAFYTKLAADVDALRTKIHDAIAEQHAAGRTVAGYGVSIGTTTLIHQFGLADRIAFLVDDNPNRESHLQGPGYAIPVLPPTAIYERTPGAILIFAWRYAEPIIARHGAFLDGGGRFIIPLPDVTIRTRP